MHMYKQIQIPLSIFGVKCEQSNVFSIHPPLLGTTNKSANISGKHRSG